MPKSPYYWSREEERKLRDLWKNGEHDPKVLAAHIGRKPEAVSKKLTRLGLVVVGDEKKNARTTTKEEETRIRLNIPNELPSVEEALKKLSAALDALAQPGLTKTEIMRFRSVIIAVKTYQKLFAEYAQYREIEIELIELSKKYERLVEKDRLEAKDDGTHST
jgi:hypothetical protein